jgi:hypothetical protein
LVRRAASLLTALIFSSSSRTMLLMVCGKFLKKGIRIV